MGDPFVVGGRVGKLGYVIEANLACEQGPEQGRFRGREPVAGRPVLITSRYQQPMPSGVAWADIRLRVPGVADLLGFEDVAPDFSIMVEVEPPGQPSHHVKLEGNLHSVAALGAELARIAGRAHAAALVLGDGLRPELIYVDNQRHPTLAGIAPRGPAFLLSPGRTMGHVAWVFPEVYAPPDSTEGKPPGDVFAVCAILYRWFVGRHYAPMETIPGEMAYIYRGDYDLSALPTGLREVVASGLRLNPAERASLQDIEAGLLALGR